MIVSMKLSTLCLCTVSIVLLSCFAARADVDDVPAPAPAAEAEAVPAPVPDATVVPDRVAVPAPDPAPGGCAAGSVLWGALPAAAISFGAGGLLVCTGWFASLALNNLDSGSGNCTQSCFELVLGAVIYTVGVALAVLGVVALGPVAAIAATTGGAVAANAQQRQVWPALVGGVPGIALGIGGIVVAAQAAMELGSVPLLAGEPIVVTRPQGQRYALGLGMIAASGIASVVGVVLADAAFGGPAPP